MISQCMDQGVSTEEPGQTGKLQPNSTGPMVSSRDQGQEKHLMVLTKLSGAIKCQLSLLSERDQLSWSGFRGAVTEGLGSKFLSQCSWGHDFITLSISFSSSFLLFSLLSFLLSVYLSGHCLFCLFNVPDLDNHSHNHTLDTTLPIAPHAM